MIPVDKKVDGDEPMKSQGGVLLFSKFNLEFDSRYP
jgi:hypothetical protein